MRINRKNKKMLFVAFAVLLVVLTGIVAVLTIQMHRHITTATVSPTDFDIGTLDSTGKVVKSTENIYSKNYINVDGLEVTVKEKSDVQYKLYFYDADKVFIISSSSWLTTDYSGTIPENAVFARIVIDPIDDAEVSLLEVFGYANQLTISYNK